MAAKKSKPKTKSTKNKSPIKNATPGQQLETEITIILVKPCVMAGADGRGKGCEAGSKHTVHRGLAQMLIGCKKAVREEDYVAPPIGSAAIPPSGQAVLDLERLKGQRYLSLTNCLELLFGKSEEPQDHLNRLASWRPGYRGYFLLNPRKKTSKNATSGFLHNRLSTGTAQTKEPAETEIILTDDSYANCGLLINGKTHSPARLGDKFRVPVRQAEFMIATMSAAPAPDFTDEKSKRVKILKELTRQDRPLSSSVNVNLLFLPGGVYEVPVDYADGMLLKHGYGVETTRPPSTESELEKLLKDILDAADEQRRLRDRVFKAIEREEIATSDKTDLTQKPGNWNMERQSFCLWAKSGWDEISPLRHFSEARHDVLREMIESGGEHEKSKGGRKAPPIKQAVIEEGKRLQENKPTMSKAQIVRQASICKLLNPDASFDGLKSLRDAEYKKRFGRNPRVVIHWFSK